MSKRNQVAALTAKLNLLKLEYDEYRNLSVDEGLLMVARYEKAEAELAEAMQAARINSDESRQEIVCLKAQLAALRDGERKAREQAILEAASIAGGATYNGDYYTAQTDARDDMARWIEKRIRELIIPAAPKMETP